MAQNSFLLLFFVGSLLVWFAPATQSAATIWKTPQAYNFSVGNVFYDSSVGVFISRTNNGTYEVNVNTGQATLYQNTTSPYTFSYTAGDGKALIALGPFADSITVFNLATNTLYCEAALTGGVSFFSSPSFLYHSNVSNTEYFITVTGYNVLTVINVTACVILWTTTNEQLVGPIAIDTLTDTLFLYSSSNYGFLSAVSLINGMVKWEITDAPSILYAASNQGVLYELQWQFSQILSIARHASTGQMVYSVPLSLTSPVNLVNNLYAVWNAGISYLIGTGNNTLIRFNPSNGTVLWETPFVGLSTFGNPVVTEQYIWTFGAAPNSLLAFSTETGVLTLNLSSFATNVISVIPFPATVAIASYNFTTFSGSLSMITFP